VARSGVHLSRDSVERTGDTPGKIQSVIKATAPVRICDNGGWTDTWFGGPGRVLNIAVTPGVEVSIRSTEDSNPVVLYVETFGDRYAVVPGAARSVRHPLLESAIDALPPPGDRRFEITVRSGVPAGCGTGTSAAVAVAMLGGLAKLRSEQPSQREVAYAAHRLEVDVLGIESGVQDQLSSALGGINFIEIDEYPEAKVQALPMWRELDSLLTLVFCGRTHDSARVHNQVIDDPADQRSEVLSRLRDAAIAARDAVLSQDLKAFGQAMIANTEAQRSLHVELVGVDATGVIEIAQHQGAFGWKVNGAGGDGGSVTILSETPEAKESLEQLIAVSSGSYKVLPIRISAVGLQVQGTI
jgi:D-glycero-alpha-D-manno-heptose-7-phosphate kinase